MVVNKKGKKFLGDRPEYGIGPFWIIISIKVCEKLSSFFLDSKIYLERYIKHEKGKIEKW